MPTSSALNLIIDITNPGKGGIIQSFQNRLPAQVPLFVRNDVETVSLRFVQPSAGTSRPWDDVDYTTAATILGLGEFDVVPSSGTNTFQFGPRTTGTTNSTTTVTITGSTAGIVNGMLVAGAGITIGTTATISGSTVTLSATATASATGVALYFYKETAAIATGTTAAAVSTAVNALTSVIAAGGVTVTLPEAGAYLFVLTSPGVTPGFFSGNAAGLNPASSLITSEVVVGATGIASQQLVEIFVNAYALNSTWSAFPSASATVTSIVTGASVSTVATTTSGSNSVTVTSASGISIGMSVTGVGIPASTTVLSIASLVLILSNNATASGTPNLTFARPGVQQIAITAGAYDGSISVTTPLLTTQAIAVPIGGTTAQTIQTALNALGAAYVVSGNAGGPWAVTDPTGNNTAMTVNVTGLVVPIGLTGTLSLSTFAMLQKFISSGLTEITLDLECQVTPLGGGQSTPLQLTVLVNKNVINLSMLAPSPIPLGLTAGQVLAIVAVLFQSASESVSAAGSDTPTIPLYTKLFTYTITAGAGSGSYTHNTTISSTNRIAGDKACIIISIPASTNPVVVIKNNAGTAIWTETSTGIAYTRNLFFTFGTDWTSDQ